MRRLSLLAFLVAAGCTRTPPEPPPAVSPKPSCEKSPPTHQLVEIRGTKEIIQKVLLLRVLEGTPDGGGRREEGDQWSTAGLLTDAGLARLRAGGCTDAAGCHLTILESKEEHAKRLDELYCPSDAAASE